MTTHNIPDSKQAPKPCPWCPVKTELSLYHLPDSPSRHVYCRRCNGAGPWGDSDNEAIAVWNSRASVAAVQGDAAQRRLQIALGYIKRAANRELPKLPCLMDEMTERELAIFNVGAAAVGNLQFIARELDALPDAAASSPAPAEPPSAVKFVPLAEDALHIAICQAVQEHHGPSANAILRSALSDYKPTQLTRTELIRVQQRSGSGEITAVMTSPAEPVQPEGEQYHEGFDDAARVSRVFNQIAAVPPATPSDAAMRAAREWMNTYHAAFKTNKEREDALAAIITRHLAAKEQENQ